MSLSQRVKLEVEGHDDIDVVFDGRDLRAWEIKHKRSAMLEPVGFYLLTWCGWHAAKRQNLLVGLNGTGDTYEKFDAVCTSVEGLAEDESDVLPGANEPAEPAVPEGADPFEVRPTKRSKKAATPKAASGG